MYVVGVDLGQKRDHTAIVMVEKPYRHPLLSTQDETLTVRLAERLPLGISYPRMVEVVKFVVGMGMRLGYVPGQVACKVVVDATGVGRPVVDALKDAGLGCQVTAVTITGGDKQNYRRGGGSSMNVPKQDLISQLLLALEEGDLKIASRMKEAGTLKRELLDVRMSRRENGTFRIGAEEYGQHDDMVIALALAVWRTKCW